MVQDNGTQSSSLRSQVFQFDGAKVRVVVKDGEPWFVASDVAEVLGYVRPADAVAEHCKGTLPFVYGETPNAKGRGGLGANTTISIIPERDIYRLVMRSKLPSAERFEEWVVGEVLPTIRKHGVYMTPEKIEHARFILFFDIPYLCTSRFVKRGSKSVLAPSLIHWKYQGSTSVQKWTHAGERKGVSKVYILLGFDRKIFEGLRRSTRRRFPPWRGQKISIGEKWEGSENFSHPWLRSEGWGTSTGNNLDVYSEASESGVRLNGIGARGISHTPLRQDSF